ncbi:MAG: hypothetical protein QM725_03840 [Lacibacter sp.]
MKKTWLLFILLICKSTFLQSQIGMSYAGINGLCIIDSISVNEIAGQFTLSDGFGGYAFLINNNYTFIKRSFDCLVKSNVDSGKCTIKNGNLVILSSEEEKIVFNLFRFDRFYFFIAPDQIKNFIADIVTTKSELKNAKPFTMDNKIYSADFLVAFKLTGKYYGKEMSD